MAKNGEKIKIFGKGLKNSQSITLRSGRYELCPAYSQRFIAERDWQWSANDQTLTMESTNADQTCPVYLSSDNSSTTSNSENSEDGNMDDSLKENFTTARESYHILPPDLRVLADAVNYGLPDTYRVPIDDKPQWLDVEKFKIGQRFAVKHIFCITFCEVLSLIMYFLIHDLLNTLIYTGNSSTPLKSYKRYLSTVLRVNSWFEDDIWNTNSTGYKNLVTARAMHLNVSKKINSESEESLKGKLGKADASRCPLYRDLKEDFKPLRPVFDSSPDCFRSQKLHLNQCEMSLAQFISFGLMILYPEKFGAHKASEEELDGLVHVWRVLGHYLGIDDRFNFCQGNLHEVKERCKNVIDYWFRPSFSNITQEWEHVTRCLAEGASYYILGVSFEVLLLYLCWVLSIDAPKLYSSLTWGQYAMLNVIKVTMCVMLRIPGMLAIFNLLLHWALNRAQITLSEKLKLLEDERDLRSHQNF